MSDSLLSSPEGERRGSEADVGLHAQSSTQRRAWGFPADCLSVNHALASWPMGRLRYCLMGGLEGNGLSLIRQRLEAGQQTRRRRERAGGYRCAAPTLGSLQYPLIPVWHLSIPGGCKAIV